MDKLKLIKRNELGLIEGLEYKFSAEGFIDWKSMVDPKFIYVNPSNKLKIEKKYKKPYEQIKPLEDKVEDVDLVIMLGGLKQLLNIHGYKSVHFNIKEANENYAAVSCSIIFSPSLDNGMNEVEFSDNACATLANTSGFGQKYLLELATNRSLCRTIRSYLRISIVSKEEIQGNENLIEEFDNVQRIDPINKLIEYASKRKFTFTQIQKKLVNEKFEGAENFKNWYDIPTDKVFHLLERLQKTEK